MITVKNAEEATQIAKRYLSEATTGLPYFISGAKREGEDWIVIVRPIASDTTVKINSVTGEAMNIQAKVLEYVKNAEKYLVNANEMLAKKDYNKSGEMLWGSTAELIKALGMVYGKNLPNHRLLIDFIKKAAILLRDDELRRLVVERAQALHANFYENFIEVEDFPAYYNDVHKAYKRLYEVIEKEIKARGW